MWMYEVEERVRSYLQNTLDVEEELPPSVCWVLRDLERTNHPPLSVLYYTGVASEARFAIRLAAICQKMDKKSDFVSSETERKVEEAVEVHAKGAIIPCTTVELFHKISQSTGYEYKQLVQVYPAVLNKMIANEIIFKDWFMGKYHIYWIRRHSNP